MIDIHCHILPGIDDGSPDLATSVAMAAMAADDGIETIIATPHVTASEKLSTSQIYDGVQQLNRVLHEKDIQVGVLPGAEVQWHVALTLADQFRLAGGSFFLLEFPHTYLPADSLHIIYTLVQKGIYPIIAHPERNRTVSLEPKKIVPLLEAGARIQITAGSLTGDLGPDAHACACFLIKKSMVDFIATDSHSPNFRKPILSKAVKVATKYLGRGEALRLVMDNPSAILP